MVILLFIFTLICVAILPPLVGTDGGVPSTSLPFTRLYMPESDVSLEVPLDAQQTFSASQLLPAHVSIFYPTKGQSAFGLCWMGLRIDSNNNVYPIASAGGGGGAIYKILPDGTLVNGVNDQNFFAALGPSEWFELDESGENFYAAVGSDVRVASFAEGSTSSVLISGLKGGRAITLGQGSLTGSLFVTEGDNQVSRVTLSPLGINVFAGGASFFAFPETIASAPDGTLYVMNPGFNPPQLGPLVANGRK